MEMTLEEFKKAYAIKGWTGDALVERIYTLLVELGDAEVNTEQCHFCGCVITNHEKYGGHHSAECFDNGHNVRPAPAAKSGCDCVKRAESISATRMIGMHADEVVEVYRAMQDLIAKISEQNFILKKFGEWHCDSGCPVTETKEGFCPDIDGYRAEYEKEQLELDEEDRFPFDSSECESQYNCGGCYTEYYRKQFNDKKGE